MGYQDITVKTALHKVKSDYLPYGWDLNIYRGCEHGCRYCYALYSHKYLTSMICGNPDDYFREIYIKSNIVDILEERLRSRSWKKEIININSVTDCYQLLEEKEQIMPQILKLMIKYKNPITISTKSDLILRDYDLIDELGRLTYVNIACSLITADENMQKKLEPATPSPQRRLDMIKEMAKSNASTGLHVMPIILF